jgi:hypothetical protein
MWRVAVVLVGAWVTAGCSVTVGRLAMVSTRSADPHPGGTGIPVEGRSCVRVLFFFPISPLPNLGAAIEQAIAAGGGTALTDVVVRYRVLYVPPLFGTGCYVVAGTAS